MNVCHSSSLVRKKQEACNQNIQLSSSLLLLERTRGIEPNQADKARGLASSPSHMNINFVESQNSSFNWSLWAISLTIDVNSSIQTWCSVRLNCQSWRRCQKMDLGTWWREILQCLCNRLRRIAENWRNHRAFAIGKSSDDVDNLRIFEGDWNCGPCVE